MIDMDLGLDNPLSGTGEGTVPDSPTCTYTLWIPVPETLAGWPDPCYCLDTSEHSFLAPGAEPRYVGVE